MAKCARAGHAGAKALVDAFNAAFVFDIYIIQQGFDFSQVISCARVGAPIGAHAPTEKHVDVAGAVGGEAEIPEIAGGQGDQQRGVNRQQPRDAALVTLQRDFGRVGKGQRNRVIFHDVVVVE